MSNFEFYCTYSALSGLPVDVLYIPTAEADTGIDVDGCDVLLDGSPDNLSEWGQITGKSGQYAYSGAVMHPSETADDDTIREWVKDAGGDTFALVPVEVPCGYCVSGEPMEHNCEENEPAGWAIIYLDAA